MSTVTLRPITDSDQDFLIAVYGATRAQEIALTDWDAATAAQFVRMQFDAQHKHYQQHHPKGSFDVVLLDGERAGRLYVSRSARSVHVVDIALLPAFRGLGAGTALMRDLLEEAGRDGKSVTIHVEVNNPALVWYQRLGFTELSTGGFHRLMECRPMHSATA